LLIGKVKKGGKGTWGPAPMPPYSPRVSDANIEKLVDFILGLVEL
jgi:cytochrome c